MVDLSWWDDPSDDGPEHLLGLGVLALGELARIESSAELPAVLAGLTREQVEAIALAGVFDRRRHTSTVTDYMAWAGGG